MDVGASVKSWGLNHGALEKMFALLVPSLLQQFWKKLETILMALSDLLQGCCSNKSKTVMI